MNMGSRIKELRLENNMTQEELGAVLGVQKSAIRKYEKGEVENIKRSAIKKMADLFCVTPSYLMGFTDERIDTAARMYKLFEQLDALDKGIIIGTMEEMLRSQKYIKESAV